MNINNTSRRNFISRGLGLGAGLAVGGPALLSACGSDGDDGAAPAATDAPADTTSPTTPAAPSLGTLDLQLGWIKNVQWAGEYMADQNGHYASAGFSSVDLLAGGPNVSVNNVIVGQGALLGMSGCDVTGPAILEGAPLIAIGAVRQTNPLCIMSLSDNPIESPSDMIGQRIGLQAINETTWQAFLAVNDIDPDSINTIPAQFDPQPLAAGEVDGWFSFFANEPNSLRVRGYDVTAMLLAEHGFPLVSDIIVARRDALDENRDAIRAALRAQILGWKDMVADPDEGARLAVEVYGKDLGLDLEEQTLAAYDHVKLIVTDDTRANGLFTVTDELVAQSIESLGRGGIEITADELFDFSILDEIYAEDPTLAEGL